MSRNDAPGTSDLAVQRAKRVTAESRTRMLDAGLQLLREQPPAALTVDAVAVAADVVETTAYQLFPSTTDLIVEMCLRRIRGVALTTSDTRGSIGRVAAQLSQMMQVVSEEPALATACAAVFLDAEPAAERIREQIGLEIHQLIASAVGPGAWPEVITTLELIFSGALIQAAAGTMTFDRAADRVQTAVSLILEGVPLC